MKLHLIDGTYELFRGHFSKRPEHKAPDGQDVKACMALCSSLLYLVHEREEGVTHVGIAFDNPIRSFRNDLFDGYKTDEGVDPAILAQFDLAEDTARALGMHVWRMDRWEADDALGTAAVRYAGEVEQVRILTPDKDLGQVLQGTRVVQVDRVRKRVIDEAALLENRGIAPKSVPDWLALVGDTADGIPGVPGFGEKTAATLLRRYEKLEGIPRDGKWDVPVRGADRLAETLRARWDDALLYRKLATLDLDVPIGTLADLAWKGVPRAAFEAWSARVGAKDMASRITRWA